MKNKPAPFSDIRGKKDILPQQLAAGPCPFCGRVDNQLNDVPLTAFCNGSEEEPHREWSRVVPGKYNPDSPLYQPTAKPDLPTGIRFPSKKRVLTT